MKDHELKVENEEDVMNLQNEQGWNLTSAMKVNTKQALAYKVFLSLCFYYFKIVVRYFYSLQRNDKMNILLYFIVSEYGANIMATTHPQTTLKPSTSADAEINLRTTTTARKGLF